MKMKGTILLKTDTRDLKLSKVKKIALLVLMYNVYVFGVHKYKKVPKLSVINNPNLAYYGMFDCGTNTIVVNRFYASTIKLFIMTLLHEYTHYLQNMTLYKSILKKVGYDNHPYEVEARNNEKHYTKVYKQIKQLI